MATADTAYLDRAAGLVPAGWYGVPGHLRPGPGEVRTTSLAGEEVVLWATAEDRLVVAEAHCPHFGAHLGHGGVVEDGCLRCPFHGWRYDVDGRHVGIPGHDTATAARLDLRPVRRVDGQDLVWSSPDPTAAPWAPTPFLADLPDGARELGTLSGSDTGLHLAMIEGIVDVAHFPALHGLQAPGIEGLDFGEGPQASVELHLESGAVAHLALDGLSRLRERMEHGAYTLWMVGEYWLHDAVHAHGQVRFWGDGPTAAGVDRLYRRFRRVYERQAEEDGKIWRHRSYGAAAAYGVDDRPVVAFRRWAQQFFPEA
jgi:phenylpropionate dioxygenase-like ring-hydroxylating dioxygenase large terminal subunit